MTQSWDPFAGPKRTEITYRKNGVMLNVTLNNTYGLKFSTQGLGLVSRNKELSNRKEERLECSSGSQEVSNCFMTVKKEIVILGVQQKSSFRERRRSVNFLVQGCERRIWDCVHQLWSCIEKKKGGDMQTSESARSCWDGEVSGESRV